MPFEAFISEVKMASSKVSVFQILIILCAMLYLLQAQAAHSFGKTLPDIGMIKICNISKIYQFGGSKADTGNRRIEDALDQCNLPPYGQSFFGKPTGRCSDGLLMIDYIASAIGIPFLNPYLDSKANFRHGANFAVGGSTSLPVKENANVSGTRSSLNVQINWMSKFFVSNCSSNTYCSPWRHVKSLFVVGEAGTNDYTNALFQGKTVKEIKSKLMPQVVRAIMRAVRNVISAGAERIIVPGQYPLGCFPIYLTAFPSNSSTAYDKHKCLTSLNDLAEAHNNYLQHAISTLQTRKPHTKIVYGDYYNAFEWLLNNAPHIGLDAESTLKACCGTGGKYNLNSNQRCGISSVPVCPDPDRHISWDGVHLTQKANNLIATWVVAKFLLMIDCKK
ncbi:acetylajmalan esterase [Daucus carota subsp. sativus]